MTAPIETTFLRDVDHGGDPAQPQAVAAQLAAFVADATTSLDIAIYDFRLSDALAGPVVDALTTAADRGVGVRIGYDAGKPAAADTAAVVALEADPAPPGTGQWITEHFAGTAVATRPIKAAPQLMHSKYVVRDAPTTGGAERHGAEDAGAGAGATTAVWTGSTNFTDDAWTHQENNIVVLASADVAAAYRTDFGQLWADGAIRRTGRGDTGLTVVGDVSVGWDFAPGDGPAMDLADAARVAGATTRVVVAAMVLTSHTLLAALVAAVDRGVALSGIYDAGQMDPIVDQWKANPADAEVLSDFIAVAGHLAAKQSAPYSPDGLHDFMHHKVLVTDDQVTTGSFNFSRNAESNAENQVHLTDAGLADTYAAAIAALVSAYSA